MKKQYPISKPYITNGEKADVLKVLESGYLSLGPAVKEFEEAFAKKIGTKYACAVNSGTAGLHLALIAANIAEGDEVITTPFSFVASANAILYVGATPVFADIDPLTYNIDPARIEEKISEKTKAILVVHIFGQTADMDPIRAIAKKHGLKIIEDACESILAEHKGKAAGTFGESAVFAFYPNKQMTTGEGGMIVTDSEDIFRLCASLRNQGRDEDMQWLDHKILGYNYRLDEMSAALGLAQLKKIDFLVAERRKIAAWYSEALSSHQDVVQIPAVAEYNTHSWFVYVVKLQNQEISRDDIIQDLQKKGIATKPYLPSIHLFDFYRKRFGFKEGDFPISESVSRSTLALPIYIGLTKEDIAYIVDILIATIKDNHHD